MVYGNHAEVHCLAVHRGHQAVGGNAGGVGGVGCAGGVKGLVVGDKGWPGQDVQV